MKLINKIPDPSHPLLGIAAVMVDQIIGDLKSRTGLSGEWHSLRSAEQEEIRDAWVEIALASLAEVAP